MTASPAVKVVVTGDTKGLEKALKSSGSALGGFGKQALAVFGGNLLTKGFDAAIGGIEALGSFALGGIDKLDKMGDSVARLDTLAKGLGKVATSADLSKWGVDKNEAAQSALAIAKVGKSLKVSGSDLRKMTPNLQKYAAQLASLGDGDPVKQADLLAKALAGNAKAAKALGVALPKGGTALQNYNALTKQLGPQLTKATSGQASLADMGDRWDATLTNLQLQLAGFLEKLAPVVSTLLDALLPALGQLVNTVGPVVTAFFNSLSAAVTGFVKDGGLQTIGGLFAGFATVVGRMAAFFVKNVLPVILALAQSIADNLAPLLPLLSDAFDALLPILTRVWGFVGSVVVPLLQKYLLPALSQLIGFVLQVATAFLRFLGPAIDTIAGLFGDLMRFLQPVLDALGKIAGLASGVIGTIGSIHLPFSAPAPAGARAGTLTTGSVNLTFQMGVGDPVAIGRTVSRYLGAYAGRGGRPW